MRRRGTDLHSCGHGPANDRDRARLAETLLPGCAVAVHSEPEGSRDPLFDPIEAGIAKPDWEIAAKAVRERLGDHPDTSWICIEPRSRHFEYVLAGGGAPKKLIEPPEEISVSVTGKGVQLNEPLSVASTLSENLLLEYTDGMQGKDLGWGRLDADNLFRILELHAAYADLTRRTLYLARARGSNLLDHVLLSMEQAATGKAVPGALGPPGAAVLILVGPRYKPVESFRHARPFLALARVSAGRHAARRRAHLFAVAAAGHRTVLRAHAVSCADTPTDAKRHSTHDGGAARKGRCCGYGL